MKSLMSLLLPIVLAQEELAPVRIEGKIESWYKVTQKIGDREEHIGYATDSIEGVKSGSETTYAYGYEFAASVFTQGQALPVGFQVTAQLNASYEPLALNGKYVEGDKEFSFEYYAVTAERFLRINNERRYDLTKDEVIHLALPLTVLQLRQQGLLSKKGLTHNLTLYYPKGDQGRNTADVQLDVVRHDKVVKMEARGKEKPEEKDKAPVTFVGVKGYPTTIRELAVSQMQVDRWGRAILVGTEGSLTLGLAKDKEEAVGPEGSVPAQGRRDPFRKDLVLTKKEKTGPKTTTKKDPKIKKDPEVKMSDKEKNKALVDLNGLALAILQAHEARNFPEAQKEYRLFLERYLKLRGLRKDSNSKDAKELKAIKERVEGGYIREKDDKGEEILRKEYGGWKVVSTEGFELKQQIITFAQSDELVDMEKRLEELQKLLARPELDDDTPAVAKLQDYLDESEVLVMTTRVRLEFVKIPLKLTGTSVGVEDEPQRIAFELRILGHRVRVDEEIAFLKSTSFARILVDKKEADFRLGDVVKIGEGPELRVDAITRYGATILWPEHQRELKSRKRVTIKAQLRELSLTK